MDYRNGKCSQCGAEYKIPASFAHNVARCRNCQGVVHLSPAPGAAGRPRESAPGLPTRSHEPKAESARPRPSGAGPRPSASPSSVPQPRPVSQPRPPAPSPATAKGAAPERAKSPEPAPAEASAAAPSREKQAPHVPLKREPPATRTAPDGKKRIPRVAILSVVALVVAAAVLILFRAQIFGAERAGPSSDGALSPALDPLPEPGTNDSAGGAASEGQREPTTAPATRPARSAADPEAKDPAMIRLGAIPDFEPTADTTSEEWTRMNAWAAQWLDVGG